MFDKTPAWYEAQNVAEIEDFDQDQYGNTWFNVKFQGNAETFMWLAKETPEEGQKYYGHFEPTKSGKRLRFKRDQEPEDEEKPAGANPKPDKAFKRDVSGVPIEMIKSLLPYFDVQTLLQNKDQYMTLIETARQLTEDALSMVDKIRESE